MSYDTEQDLFEVVINSPFIQGLSNNELSCKLIEPKGLFGIPDLLIADLSNEKEYGCCFNIIAFEMKLHNWKRALAQAFRYLAFSNISYVVLDHDHVNPALKNIENFKRSNVGLLSFDGEGLMYSHFEPSIYEPYCDKYTSQIYKMVGITEVNVKRDALKILSFKHNKK